MTFTNGLQPQQGDTDWILWCKTVQILAQMADGAGLTVPGNFTGGLEPQGDDTDHVLYAKAASITYAMENEGFVF